ncbi:MAG: hypothetical protein AB1715_10695, partial [Acidobacteriota bacterium]
KILLLDFEESAYRRLLDRRHDVEVRETNWKSGRVEGLVPPQDCRIVIYQADLSDYGSGLHAGDAERFEKIVAGGGAVICFVGNCQEYHLTNVIGQIPGLKFSENKLPDKIYEATGEPVSLVFSQFRPFISHAYELFQTHNHLGKTIDLQEWDPPYDGKLQVLAESFKNYPISVLIRRGQGFYLLLPWFGEKNIEVTELILEQVLPEISPHLLADEGMSWLDSYEYIFPGLLEVFKEMEEENERHRQSMRRFEEKIEELKTTEQEPFNKLLTAEGKELQQAVVNAFKYLNWLNVVDVIEYWKHVIRIKEEDIWLLDEDGKSIEQLIRGSQLVLVAVHSGEAGAKDEDCLLLQRYKGRRMQEFDNTKMKAVLVGNYFSRTEAKLREVPFAEQQINEATKDGNGLLTTYELFRAVKAEKEKKIPKEAIREQLKTKVGLITFDY